MPDTMDPHQTTTDCQDGQATTIVAPSTSAHLLTDPSTLPIAKSASSQASSQASSIAVDEHVATPHSPEAPTGPTP